MQVQHEGRISLDTNKVMRDFDKENNLNGAALFGLSLVALGHLITVNWNDAFKGVKQSSISQIMKTFCKNL